MMIFIKKNNFLFDNNEYLDSVPCAKYLMENNHVFNKKGQLHMKKYDLQHGKVLFIFLNIYPNTPITLKR